MQLSALVGPMVNVIVFAVLGMIMLGISFAVFDKLTPYKLWDEVIKEKNLALAVVVAGMTIAMGIIIGLAVHG